MYHLSRRQLLLAYLPSLPCAALAQARSALRIVVGFPAGATSDTLARMLAEGLSRTLGEPVIVDNRPGAGTRISAEIVKNAPPDGRTLLMAPLATMAIFPTTDGGRLHYDPARDFAPVAHLAHYDIGLAVADAVPAGNLAQYLAWVQADPARRGFYGLTAVGSLPHLFGLLLAKAAGLALTPVPFTGTADAVQALASGQVASLVTVVSDLQPMVEAHRAKVLAVAGAARSSLFPGVPTFREQGLDLAASAWYGLFAPAGTSPALVAQLSQATTAVLGTPAVQDRMRRLGLEPTGQGAAQLAAAMQADTERWRPVIRAAGLVSTD